MSKEEMIEQLIEMMETEEELSAESVLEDIDEWDSLAKLSLMAFAKKEFSKVLTASEIREFVTVGDICDALL